MVKVLYPVPLDYTDPDGNPAQKCSICENSGSVGESLYFGGPEEMLSEYPFCKYCADNIPLLVKQMIRLSRKYGGVQEFMQWLYDREESSC